MTYKSESSLTVGHWISLIGSQGCDQSRLGAWQLGSYVYFSLCFVTSAGWESSSLLSELNLDEVPPLGSPAIYKVHTREPACPSGWSLTSGWTIAL